MIIYYGLDSLLGAIVALVLIKPDIDLTYVFFGLAIMTVFPAGLVAMLPNPTDATNIRHCCPLKTLSGVSLLSPLQLMAASSCMPSTSVAPKPAIQTRTARRTTLVTIVATVLFGIQLGHDCIGMVLTDGAKLAAA
ncbi:hypothetical protein GN244_ATG11929 [Phytophthora infestans]|uniref:Uncharacterized protein n=1 Tax=Phytophthora infestans TaxID=4787 RepID=A0A833WT01_PHYIN|nr:hypothetical protein GN244_ATG11929 [Phytophthora infestans]